MFTKILVATDGSDQGTKAVDVAADLAVKYDAELVIGHVLLHGEPPSAFRRMAEVEHLVNPPKVQKPDSKNTVGGLIGIATQAEQNRISHDIIVALGDRVIEVAEASVADKGVSNYSSQIVEGDAANQVLKLADEVDADLIVIGTRGFGPIKSMLMGSVSHKVTQHAECACMTVK